MQWPGYISYKSSTLGALGKPSGDRCFVMDVLLTNVPASISVIAWLSNHARGLIELRLACSQEFSLVWKTDDPTRLESGAMPTPGSGSCIRGEMQKAIARCLISDGLPK